MAKASALDIGEWQEWPASFTEGRNKPHEMIQLFCQSRFCESSDPKDRVYALLDMMKPPQMVFSQAHRDETGIKVDYTRSVANVFADAAELIMQQEQSL